MLSRIATLTTRLSLPATAKTMQSKSLIFNILISGRRLATTDAPAASAVTCSIKKREETSPDVLPFKEGPERDVVNFPRRKRPLYCGKVRMQFLPEEWFNFFYPKTGALGPYLWLTGFVTFVVSKEIYVLEHEFYTGLSLLIVLYFVVTRLGPMLADFLDKESDQLEADLQQYHTDSIDNLTESIKNEELSQWRAQGQMLLFDAKRENVLLQLEADYRQRLLNVYNEVKKRLDYQLELKNAARRIDQQHMVKWIADNVVKSITPQQEKEALQQCIGNLKNLASNAA